MLNLHEYEELKKSNRELDVERHPFCVIWVIVKNRVER